MDLCTFYMVSIKKIRSCRVYHSRLVGKRMKAHTIICIVLLAAACTLECATITVRLRAYPNAEKIVQKLKKPGKIAQYTVEGLVNHNMVTGIFATYAGFLEASNSYGYIVFERKHNQPVVYLLVTKHITPIVMFEQTIQHWKLIPEISAQFYKIERITDADTELTYWQVEQADIPKDNVIPLETIIIIAQPKHIYVPTGITLTDTGPNLLLPNVYTRKGIKIINNSLYILNLAHLFGQVHVTHDKKATYYALQPQE